LILTAAVLVLTIPLAQDVFSATFEVGEKLKYDFNYGIINAGTHTMEVSELDTINGQIAYKLNSETKSNNFVDTFYKVRDEFSSWIDTSNMATLQFSKSLNEGKYTSNYSVRFDYDEMRAYSSKDTVISIDTYMYDVLSLFYYIRSLNLSVGDTINMRSFDNDEVTEFNLKVIGEDKVKVPSGKYKCLIIEPYIEGDFLFKYEGNLKIWLSKEKPHLPVLMKSKATLGSFVLRLADYRPAD
jgi:hypothetical protein